MGFGKTSVAVTDAGPLIHLFEIDAISLLSVFETIFYPESVWFETIGKNRIPESTLSNLPYTHHHVMNEDDLHIFIEQNRLEHLHVGEQEYLCLCKQLGIALILTDDLAVRKVAKQMCITPVGSLGIIVKAYQLELISIEKAERLLKDLYDKSSLYITDSIVEMAIEQLYEFKIKKESFYE